MVGTHHMGHINTTNRLQHIHKKRRQFLAIIFNFNKILFVFVLAVSYFLKYYY